MSTSALVLRADNLNGVQSVDLRVKQIDVTHEMSHFVQFPYPGFTLRNYCARK